MRVNKQNIGHLRPECLGPQCLWWCGTLGAAVYQTYDGVTSSSTSVVRTRATVARNGPVATPTRLGAWRASHMEAREAARERSHKA